MKKVVISSFILGLLFLGGVSVCNTPTHKEMREKWKGKGLLRDYREFGRRINDDEIFVKVQFLKKPKMRKFINEFCGSIKGYSVSKPLNILMAIGRPGYRDWVESVIFMINNGADINYKDFRGKKPLDYMLHPLHFSINIKGEIDKEKMMGVMDVLASLIQKKPEITDEARKKFENIYKNVKEYCKKDNKMLKKLEEINSFFKGKKSWLKKDQKSQREGDYFERLQFMLNQ